MILGITGGSGCGKTTLLKQIEALGGLVLDCDKIYHDLLRSDTDLLSAIDTRFPGTVENGVLNRKKLASIVFSDKKDLLDLNEITHKSVKNAVLSALKVAPPLAAIDAIGLFEGGLSELCDMTVAVIAPTEDRVKRLMLRDGITEEQAHQRISAQHDNDWFRQNCDYTLENTGKLSLFQGKCIAFFQEIGIIEL